MASTDTIDTDRLGQYVRRVWVEGVVERALQTGIPPKPSHLVDWEEMPEDEKKIDRMIGAALYTLGRHDTTMRLLEGGLGESALNASRQTPFQHMLLPPETGAIIHKAIEEFYEHAVPYQLAVLVQTRLRQYLATLTPQ